MRLKTTKASRELFLRSSWPPALKRAPLVLRLLNRECWGPDGLTSAEVDVLERIADGDLSANALIGGRLTQLDARGAVAALSYPWLRRQPE